MKREAFVMFLKSGYEAEYEKRHKEIWPELKKILKDNGISDYSIFWNRETNHLFGYQYVNGENSSQDLGENPVIKKWWAYMADIMETNKDNSPVTIPLFEVFHLD